MGSQVTSERLRLINVSQISLSPLLTEGVGLRRELSRTAGVKAVDHFGLGSSIRPEGLGPVQGVRPVVKTWIALGFLVLAMQD